MKLFLPLIAAFTLAGAPAAFAQTPATAVAAFLASNARAPGVVSLPSGLQYKVVKAGPAGPSPTPGSIIKVHYEGALVSGQVFDSSFARNRPAIMQLANLVPAWLEAIPLMHVGDEWTLYAPPELGYGDEGAGPIPPNSVLVFRIQLLDFMTPD